MIFSVFLNMFNVLGLDSSVVSGRVNAKRNLKMPMTIDYVREELILCKQNYEILQTARARTFEIFLIFVLRSQRTRKLYKTRPFPNRIFFYFFFKFPSINCISVCYYFYYLLHLLYFIYIFFIFIFFISVYLFI